MDNHYTGMIYADAAFPQPPPDRKVERFSNGYSIDLGPRLSI